MPNHMKFCGCKMCRRGRSCMGWLIREVNRRARKQAKEDLKRGRVPERVYSVPYTD